MATGYIKKILVDKGYGFLRPSDASHGEPDLFFHRSALADLMFDEQLIERNVTFEVFHDSATGRTRAIDIRADR